MRLLADENIPKLAVKALRDRGHDVAWVRQDAPGIPDQEVLSLGQEESRLLLTCDKDFGELAFRHGLPAEQGVVLFRIALSSPERVAHVMVAVLESRSDWAGPFSVVEDDRLRMVQVPIDRGRRRAGLLHLNDSSLSVTRVPLRGVILQFALDVEGLALALPWHGFRAVPLILPSAKFTPKTAR